MGIRPQQMEMFIASQTAESLGANLRLLEMILDRRNMLLALKQVRANKGAPGIDKITVNQIGGYLNRHWTKIKAALLDGSYNPLPVRRKQIDKPDGGVRLLGIPTVLDRIIQQAIAQVVEQIWDPTFSEFSYGFRPGRSAHDAVLQSKQYLLDGYTYVVDMDLSKFFDRVNHDRLMSRLASRIADKRVLKLIRRYLNAGTMIDGVVTYADEGTPQGGPLSPLLSNIVLDELDKELEARGHKFVRYADDFRIYCKSLKAAERVYASITRFLTVRLRLKVNEKKSAVSRPWLRKFLGFTFFHMYGQSKIRIHAKTIERFKQRIRELTDRNCGKSLYQVVKELNMYLRGWWNYFCLAEARYILKALKTWIIRRLRCLVWKQWKNPRTKVHNLGKLGIDHAHAMTCGNARKKHWRMSKVKWVAIAMPERYFLEKGLYLPGN
jgi:group II intron reverse transcriptase/maturase